MHLGSRTLDTHIRAMNGCTKYGRNIELQNYSCCNHSSMFSVILSNSTINKHSSLKIQNTLCPTLRFDVMSHTADCISGELPLKAHCSILNHAKHARCMVTHLKYAIYHVDITCNLEVGQRVMLVPVLCCYFYLLCWTKANVQDWLLDHCKELQCESQTDNMHL